MRWFLTILVTTVFTVGARAEESLRVVADLRDGSRLIGTVTTTNVALTVQTEALGKLDLPLARITRLTLTKDNEVGTVLLQNGDQIKGSVLTRVIQLQTLFGPLALPLDRVATLQVRAAGAGQVLGPNDWKTLPFPQNCDWGGPKGARATVGDSGLLLNGQPVRAVRSYRLPVEIECEFVVREDQRDGNLQFMIGSARTPEGVLPEDRLQLVLGLADGSVVFYQYLGDRQPDRTYTGEKAANILVGAPNRLKIKMGADAWVVTINQHTYQIEGLRPTPEEVLLQFWNWLPARQCQVRNVSVR